MALLTKTVYRNCLSRKCLRIYLIQSAQTNQAYQYYSVSDSALCLSQVWIEPLSKDRQYINISIYRQYIYIYLYRQYIWLGILLLSRCDVFFVMMTTKSLLIWTPKLWSFNYIANQKACPIFITHLWSYCTQIEASHTAHACTISFGMPYSFVGTTILHHTTHSCPESDATTWEF